MVSARLRALCASLAVAAFAGGVAGLVATGSPWFVLAFLVAAPVGLLAMFGGARPTPEDLPRIEEQLHRFRGAMLICFAAAAALYAIVITGRGQIAYERIHQIASLGVAFWIVAFVLMVFFAYYRTQRRLALDLD